MVGEVQRCLTMKTAVHHDTHLVSNSLWRIQPMKLIVEEWRQATIKLPCVTDHTGASIEHSLQLVSNRLRRLHIDCVTIVDARRNKSMHEGCRRFIVEWLPDTTKLTKPMEADCTRLGDMLLETQLSDEDFSGEIRWYSCIEIVRVGWGGIEDAIEDRLRRDWRVLPRKRAGNCRQGPGFSAKLALTALEKGLR